MSKPRIPTLICESRRVSTVILGVSIVTLRVSTVTLGVSMDTTFKQALTYMFDVFTKHLYQLSYVPN